MAIRSHCSHSTIDEEEEEEEEEGVEGDDVEVEEEVEESSSAPDGAGESSSSFSGAGLTLHVPSKTRIIEQLPSSSTYLVSRASRQWLSRSLTARFLKRNLVACSSSDEALTPSSERAVREEQHWKERIVFYCCVSISIPGGKVGFRREGEREKERACVSEQKRRKEGGKSRREPEAEV